MVSPIDITNGTMTIAIRNQLVSKERAEDPKRELEQVAPLDNRAPIEPEEVEQIAVEASPGDEVILPKLPEVGDFCPGGWAGEFGAN